MSFLLEGVEACCREEEEGNFAEIWAEKGRKFSLK